MLSTTGHAQHWTPETIHSAFAAFYASHHRPPRMAEFVQASGLPSRGTVRRLCGSLTAVYAALGIPLALGGHPRRNPHQKGLCRRPNWPRERIIEAIHAFRTRHGRWPETSDFCQAVGLPHRVTVMRAFGTLAEARRQAGMSGGGHEGHGGAGRGGGLMPRQRGSQAAL